MTREVDLQLLADCGVHAVGLNFVASSPRFVNSARAAELAQRAHELGLVVYGVTMNLTAREIQSVLDQIDLDAIQLHGTESATLLNACGQTPVVKAVSWSGRAEEQRLAESWRLEFEKAAVECAFLVDAYAPVQGGGTGKVARWTCWILNLMSSKAFHSFLQEDFVQPT